MFKKKVTILLLGFFFLGGILFYADEPVNKVENQDKIDKPGVFKPYAKGQAKVVKFKTDIAKVRKFRIVGTKEQVLTALSSEFRKKKNDIFGFLKNDLKKKIRNTLASKNGGYLVPWRKIGLRKRALKHSSFDYGKVDLKVIFDVNTDIITISAVVHDIIERAKYLRKTPIRKKTKSRNAKITIRSVKIELKFSFKIDTGRFVVVQHKLEDPGIGSTNFDVSGGDPLGAWIVEKVMNKYGKPFLRDLIKKETVRNLNDYFPGFARKALKSIPYLIDGYRIMAPNLIMPSKELCEIGACGFCKRHNFPDTLNNSHFVGYISKKVPLYLYRYITCKIH